MNIGFVSAWLERGATYVTKNYIDMLEDEHNIFVFARAGEYFDSENKYKKAKITKGYRLDGTRINWKQFEKWIKNNSLDMIIFNEQSEIECVYKAGITFPNLLLGAYIDYYTEATVDDFKYYHFLLCNTKRHYSVFKWHPGAFYLPWGLDIKKFKMIEKSKDELVFFHSMGMSNRKGTDVSISAFIKSKAYLANAKLIIHTQCNIDNLINKHECEKYNIEIINKIVPHPGLYHLGDVYLYPTTLDGLGLTIYEALACGLPVITTNEAPMNEVISKENGYLVDVANHHCRRDAYYWPLSFVDESSLIEAIKYYVKNKNDIFKYKKNARLYAEENLDFSRMKKNMKSIMDEIIEKRKILNEWVKSQNLPQKDVKKEYTHDFFNYMLPDMVANYIRCFFEERRKTQNEN